MAQKQADVTRSGTVRTRSTGVRQVALASTNSRKSVQNGQSKSGHGDDRSSLLPEKKAQVCKRTQCDSIPICFAGATNRCATNAVSSRWYHVSDGEHYCNECFEHVYRGEGNTAFRAWQMQWSRQGATKANALAFFCDKFLPYWIQCTAPSCRKWRQVFRDTKVTPDFISKFQCGMNRHGVKLQNGFKACNGPEDMRVAEARTEEWLQSFCGASFLENSPAGPFLTDLYPDHVGMTASVVCSPPKDLSDLLCTDLVQPFCSEQEPFLAMGRFQADAVGDEERELFGYMTREHLASYLGLRNLVMALWAGNVKEWLSKAACMRELVCRGLVRVHFDFALDKLLWFLTCQGIINCGLLHPPSDHPLMVGGHVKTSVVVIGAGASGIAAARRLQDFNVKVTVLEAQSRLGGRVYDVAPSGVVVGQGAQLLGNVVNNPIALACFQEGLKLHKLHEECRLFEPDGRKVDDLVDRQMSFHFNSLLDFIASWRQDRKLSTDVSLLARFSEELKNFENDAPLREFTQTQRQVLEFHLANLEYATGSSLSHVSALNWDQNEMLPQYCGGPALLESGYQTVLEKMAAGLDMHLNTQVSRVDYSGDRVTVHTKLGDLWTADKVIVTVPLTVLKSGVLEFNPALPQDKMDAIECLGAGYVEKIALKFSHKFWSKKTIEDKFFGCLPPVGGKRGLFNTFYSLPSAKIDQGHVLVSHVSGEALVEIEERSDEGVKDLCLAVLRKMFPDEEVPEPSWFLVSHWRQDPLAGMAYSFLPIGADGSAYDKMATCVAEKVHFAGEATSRQFPQTVTGAYLTGLREASAILSVLQDGKR